MAALSFATVPGARSAHSSARWSTLSHGMPVLHVAPAELLPLAQALKTELGFDLLLDVTAVDWPDAPERFEVVYHFYSTTHFVRVPLKTRVAEAEPVRRLADLALRLGRLCERECHDMFGIGFRGNADLRPILLYEGFVGHPLRKDYPKQQEQPLVPYRQ